MPRRKSGTSSEEVGERRVTRGSVQPKPENEAARGRSRSVKESPAKPAKTSPSPSPTKGRGRGNASTPKAARGRGRGRGRSQKKKAEPMDDEPEEDVDEEQSDEEEANEEVIATEEAPEEEKIASPKRGKASPKRGAGGRGRGRGKGRGQARGRSSGGWSKPEEEDNPAEEGDVDTSIEKPKDSSPRRRSGRSPKVSSSTESTPQRRSGRSTTKLVDEPTPEEDSDTEEPIVETPENKDQEDKEEKCEVEAAVEKSEAEVEKSEDAEAEVDVPSESRGQKRKHEEVPTCSVSDSGEEETSTKKQKVEDDQIETSDSKEVPVVSTINNDEDMDTTEPTVDEAKPSTTSEPPVEKQETSDEKQETSESTSTVKVTEDSEIKQAEDVPTPEPTDVPMEEDNTKNVQAEESTPSSAPVDADYVVVSLEDVPPPNSSEVAASIPKPPESPVATPQEESTAVSEEVHKSPVTNNEKPTEEADIEEPDTSKSTSVTSVEKSNLIDVNGGDCIEAEAPSITTSNSGNSVHNQISAAPPLNMNNGPSVDLMAENGHALNPLYNRTFIANPSLDATTINPQCKFSVVSYNILAECHMPEGRYPWLTADQIENRHNRLLAELRHLNGDVLCLQEVSPKHFSDQLQPDLKKLGYDGVFVKRSGDTIDEGEATFFRTDRFTLSNQRTMRLTDVAKKDIDSSGLDSGVKEAVVACLESFAVCALVHLKCKNTGKTVSVGNIHVAWDRFERQDLQCLQVASAIRELVNLAGGADKPHIICGDFNSWMGTPVYQLTQEGYLNDESMTTLQAINAVHLPDGSCASAVHHWWKGFQHTSNNLRSSYATVQGTEPKTSQFPHDRVLRGVDIIWYASDSLDMCGVLQTAPEADMDKGVPNATYPSDHVSIQSYLAFK